MGSYVPSTPVQRREMLEAIGLTDVKELFRDVPASMLLDRPLELPGGMSELEVVRAMTAMAEKNTLFPTVLRGAGAYDHYIPSIVKYVPAKEEFLTAYSGDTYADHGKLQTFFEFTSMMGELLDMDVVS